MRHLALLCILSACALLPAVEPAPAPAAVTAAPTEAEIAALTFDDVAIDNGWVTPFAPDLSSVGPDSGQKEQWDDFMAKLDTWPPGKVEAVAQRVRNLAAVPALVDLGRGMFEGEVPYAILERLKAQVPKEELIRHLAAVVLQPAAATVPLTAPELDINHSLPEPEVRERAQIYAKKMLGRLLGKLPR